jgi:hypothetical protein
MMEHGWLWSTCGHANGCAGNSRLIVITRRASARPGNPFVSANNLAAFARGKMDRPNTSGDDNGGVQDHFALNFVIPAKAGIH